MKSKYTNIQEFRNLYNRFYTRMRKYIWDYDTIELLAKLEELIYTDFPKIDSILRVSSMIYKNIRMSQVDKEYKDILLDSLDAIIDLAENTEDVVVKLAVVQEVVDNENN